MLGFGCFGVFLGWGMGGLSVVVEILDMVFWKGVLLVECFLLEKYCGFFMINDRYIFIDDVIISFGILFFFGGLGLLSKVLMGFLEWRIWKVL